MKVCHSHNLIDDPEADRRYGIRVRLRPGDAMQQLFGPSFEKTHWYATSTERDRALADMAGEHLYSRRGDRPVLLYEPINR